MSIPEKDVDIITSYCLKLSLFEVSMGSLLHSFRVPMTGQLLSLNQILFMSLITSDFKGKSIQKRAPLYVSQICALLKSLSPAGKKLGPMLSISMQGLLFILPQYVLAVNVVSVMLGALLSSFWAFAQPLLTLYIFFGSHFFKATEHYFLQLKNKVPLGDEYILILLLIPIFIKVVSSMGVAYWAYQKENKDLIMGRVSDVLEKRRVPVKKGRPSLLRDLTRPIFLISLFFTSLYIYSNRELLAPTVWTYMRPIAICVVLLYVNRSSFVVRYIERRQDKTFFQILKSVNAQVEKAII